MLADQVLRNLRLLALLVDVVVGHLDSELEQTFVHGEGVAAVALLVVIQNEWLVPVALRGEVQCSGLSFLGLVLLFGGPSQQLLPHGSEIDLTLFDFGQRHLDLRQVELELVLQAAQLDQI